MSAVLSLQPHDTTKWNRRGENRAEQNGTRQDRADRTEHQRAHSIADRGGVRKMVYVVITVFQYKE
jgi:hypothetical protein